MSQKSYPNPTNSYKMSFLKQLQKQRSNLKQTTTILTTQSGEKFLENKLDSKKNLRLNERSYGFIVDTKPDKIPACIVDNFLYLGSQDAVNWETIVEYQLTHILSIGIEMPIIEEVNFSSDRIKNKFITCLDLPSTNLRGVIIEEATEFIEEVRKNGGRVLVHCNAGVSRSASVVIGYLMQRKGLTFTTAYNLVKSRRECIQPNSGFMQQLQSLESDKVTI